jgi:hypothetical protein
MWLKFVCRPRLVSRHVLFLFLQEKKLTPGRHVLSAGYIIEPRDLFAGEAALEPYAVPTVHCVEKCGSHAG